MAPGDEGTMPDSWIEAALRRDRWVVGAGLAALSALAWIYLLTGGGMDMDMSMPMDMPMHWSAGYAVTVLAMWWIMMIAMMLPSAAPMILLHAAVNRRSRERGRAGASSGWFTTGYLLTWGGFSLVATLGHWALEQTNLISAMSMASTSRWLGAVLLIAAGIYQLSPLKHACLRHCRGPLAFVTRHWRPGRRGALVMGLVHGAYCVGCCWVVMGLLFYGGVMNLWWIVGLALLVLGEKMLPAGHRLGSLSGVGFLVWGSWLLVAAGA